ncbi:MAG: outer membrane lipoprotein chaperone LolA [Bradymonadia bacterium]
MQRTLLTATPLLIGLLAFTAQGQSPETPAAPEAPAAPSTPTAESVLQGIQSFYKDSKDLKAGFTQHYTYKVHKRTQKSSGTVFFKKPRRMRWDYRKPIPKVFMADGNTLWVYEPEEAQVFKRDLSRAQLPVALTFMSGEGDLTTEFNAELLTPKDPAKDHLVKLTPKRDQGHYKSLTLSVDPKTYQVRESTVIDPVGNINRVVFQDLKTNVGLPDAGFTFKVPNGVKVIEGEGR